MVKCLRCFNIAHIGNMLEVYNWVNAGYALMIMVIMIDDDGDHARKKDDDFKVDCQLRNSSLIMLLLVMTLLRH